MNKIFIKNIVMSLIIIGFSIFFTVFYTNKKCTKIGTINTNSVFNNFNMTRELKSEGENVVNRQQRKIDSIYSIINTHSNRREELIKKLITERESLNKYNEQYTKEQSVKIWSRINMFLAQFSKENNYEIILGTQPNNILYTSQKNDITTEFTNYLNNHYEGGQ